MLSFRTILFSPFIVFTVFSAMHMHAEQIDTQRVHSLEYMNELCTRMAKHVGLDSKKITVDYKDSGYNAEVCKDSDGYRISFDTHFADELSKDEVAAVMCHELMHILHGDCDTPISIPYQQLSNKQRYMIAGILSAVLASLGLKESYYRKSRIGIALSATALATWLGTHCMSKVLLKYSTAMYSSFRHFLFSRHGIAIITGGIASGAGTAYWTANHDDIITRSVMLAGLGFVAGHFLTKGLNEVAKLIAYYRCTLDSRRREAWADHDAAKKFNCGQGLISFIEKIRERREDSRENLSLSQRLKQRLQHHFHGTHPTDTQRITVLKKLVPAA